MPVLAEKGERSTIRKVAYTLSTPVGWNWAHICSTMCLGVAVSEILADFLNFHIWAWNPEFEERSQSCICSLFLSQGVEIKHIFSLRATVFEIRANFKISIFGHEIWNLKKGAKVAYIRSYPKGVEIKLIFTLRASVFEIRDDFHNFHIWACNLGFEDRS